jgi:hypothetical protein
VEAVDSIPWNENDSNVSVCSCLVVWEDQLAALQDQLVAVEVDLVIPVLRPKRETIKLRSIGCRRSAFMQPWRTNFDFKWLVLTPNSTLTLTPTLTITSISIPQVKICHRRRDFLSTQDILDLRRECFTKTAHWDCTPPLLLPCWVVPTTNNLLGSLQPNSSFSDR